MHRLLFYRLILFFLLFMPAILGAQEKKVIIRVQQDESVLLDAPVTEITLKRNPFKIQVYLQHMDGVYCFASVNDSIYRVTGEDSVPGFRELPFMAMAEDKFNKDKELLISNEGWSYWFYDPALDWHRFNRKIVVIDSQLVVGTKTIKYIRFVEEEKVSKVKDFSTPLYLFFVAVEETDADGKPVKELMRRKLKINWVNDD